MPSASQAARYDDTTLAILAGGAGSRMGQPKGFLTIGGQPILDYLLDHLEWPGPTMLVTAPQREHPPGWPRFTREISDPIPGGGPLLGILTALEHVDTPLLLVLTIDMPGVRLIHCKFVLDSLRNDRAALGVMTRRNVQGNGQVEPFPCALRRDAAPSLCRRLTQGKRSVQGLLEVPGFMAIHAPTDWPEQVWMNLNFPEDLRNLVP